MKSTIKLDVNVEGRNVIKVNAIWSEDMRDKHLCNFINQLVGPISNEHTLSNWFKVTNRHELPEGIEDMDKKEAPVTICIEIEPVKPSEFEHTRRLLADKTVAYEEMIASSTIELGRKV